MEKGSLCVWLGFLSYCIGLTTAEHSTNWVAPSGEECDTTENCTTLEEYARRGAFSQSNVVWIFKEGEHVLKQSMLVISNVSNVTFTGETACERGHHGSCIVKCRRNSICMLLFVASNNITIQYLYFVYYQAARNPVSLYHLQRHLPKEEGLCYNQKNLQFPLSIMQFNNCIHDRKWVFIDTIHLTVRNITFVGRKSYWAVVRPSGHYEVTNCQFNDLHLAQTFPSEDPQHYFMLVLRGTHSSFMLSFNMQHVEFNADHFLPPKSLYLTVAKEEIMMTFPVVHIISDEPLNGWKANITIHNCTFSRCPPFQLSALEDPGLSVTLNCLQVDSGVSVYDAINWISKSNYLVMGSAVRIFLANHKKQKSNSQCFKIADPRISNVTVSSSHFKNFISIMGSAVLLRVHCIELCPVGMRLVLKNNTLLTSHSIKFRSAVYAFLSTENRMSVNLSTCHEYRLIIDSNNIWNNFQARRIDRSCVVFERQTLARSRHLLLPRIDNSSHNSPQTCDWQGVLYISGFEGNSRVLFTENRVMNNRAQGLTLSHSEVVLMGTNTIYQNQGYYGGGIAMYQNSQLLFMNGSHLNISSNHAFVHGGAIFVQDYCTSVYMSDKCPCFFQFIDSTGRYLQNASIESLNVSAYLIENRVQRNCTNAAAMIFNPNIDDCHLYTNFQNSTQAKVLQQIFHLPENVTSQHISSVPKQICQCSPEHPVVPCSGLQSEKPLPLYPGQQLTLNITLIGDMGLSMGGIVHVELEDEVYANNTNIYLPLPILSSHVLHSGCNTIQLPPLPFSTKQWILQLMVPLRHHQTPSIYLTDYLHFQHLTHCPLAYSLVSNTTCSQTGCECYSFLSEKVKCLKNGYLFELPTQYWIGTEEEREGHSATNVLLSSHCPQIYCATANSEMQVSLSEPDKQCKYGRTGVLCGRCPSGKSSVVYSYTCKHCTNWSILLLIPLLIAGPALIALICCLNLTVSVGSANGFLLYLNIIAINSDVLTTTKDSTDFMQALGFQPFIGVCFYNGMDAFASTLLTYLFPVYLLILVGLICLLPKCKWVNMHKINRRIGPRITPVLATVILLSYTQLAESVVHSLLFVEVYVTDGNTTTSRLVWMFDGSLEYFHSPKHIVLACLALLVLMCFLLPVTVIAIFGDLFRRFSRGPWYMNFLDSFHGAFRFRFGFWIGIRILLRILFIVLKIFLPVDQLFLVIAYTIMTLLFLQILIRPFRGIRVRECVSKKIKDKHFSEPLQRQLVHSIDHSFLVHLIAVFMALPHDVQNVTTVLIVSKVIAYMEFAGILVYHMMEYSPVGPFVFDTWFKLQRRYRRWRENRREATLARARHNEDEGRPFDEQFDLVLRASDCTDSDYEDESESDEDNIKETCGYQKGCDKTTTKQVSVKKDHQTGPVDVPLSSSLISPLLRKAQESAQ